MSSNGRPVIRVENVWKRYKLGTKRLRNSRTLSAAFTQRLERTGLKKAGPSALNSGTLWALADVSFSVQQGEALGIIGANGSGKSTSLKLISRITYPWSGNVRVRGSVGSLIEIRSGIHPELTGRENIYLYGALLGFRRREIRKRFDQIVEFAELGRFIDTQVKRYSSGMEVRLGFSVAAHLEPDILLIDEVLAVGDERFQRRCMDRIEYLRRQGQTLLFVSHVMSDVQRLCPRVVYLDRATLRADGPAEEVIGLYMQDVAARPR